MINAESLRYCSPPLEYCNERLMKLDKLVRRFCEETDRHIGSIKVNLETLKDVFIRVNMREDYFLIFHKGTSICEFKSMAITCFWINKLKPFWIDVESGFNNINSAYEVSRINEKICSYMIACGINDFDPTVQKERRGSFQMFLDELKYSLRYRDLTKEALFLLFETFYYDTVDRKLNEAAAMKLAKESRQRS